MCNDRISQPNSNTNSNTEAENEYIPCKCLSLIMIDSLAEVNNNYHPLTFLEECKYKITQEKKEEPHH